MIKIRYVFNILTVLSMLFNITGACASGREILPADENLKRPINRDPTEDPTCKLAKLDGYTLKKLQADCQQVESKIEEALRDGDAIDVHGAYDIFKKIETSEPMWQRYAEQEKCIQWFDLQKAEDVVGGHFFSLKLFGYWDWKKNEPSEQIKYRYLSFLLAYGAKFKHPLAQYLLAWVMAKSDDDEGLKKAFNNLTIVLKDKEIAEVRFLVGYHYKKQGNPKKSLKIHQAGEDLYNKLAALKIRDYAHYLSNAPTVKEVVKFAEENNCGPAYQLAASIAADKEDYIKYLNAAANLKFHPSLISLGRYYEEINDLAKAREDVANIDDLMEAFESVLINVRANLISMSSRLPGRISHKNETVVANILESEIKQILTTLSDYD